MIFTGRSAGATPAIFWPSISIRPALGCSNPASMRSKVLLPHPDAPKRQNNSPFSISKDRLSTATTSSNLLVSAVNRINGAISLFVTLCKGRGRYGTNDMKRATVLPLHKTEALLLWCYSIADWSSYQMRNATIHG